MHSANLRCRNFLQLACVVAAIVMATIAYAETPGAQQYQVLHRFDNGVDGNALFGGLVLDSAGNLYGTTTDGGAFESGTIFKVSSAGDLTTLYSFNGNSD